MTSTSRPTHATLATTDAPEPEMILASPATTAHREKKRDVRTPRLRFRPPPVTVIVASLILLLFVLWAIAPSMFTATDPLRTVPKDRLLAPAWDHPFGTDDLGRNILVRTIYGTRQTFLTSIGAVGIAVLVGALAGLLAGYVGGIVDDVTMRIVDLLSAVPALLLAMALITALGTGSIATVIALGVAGIGAIARVMRASVLRIRAMTYIDAARSLGMRDSVIMVKHVLPNSFAPVASMAVTEFGQVILAVTALSFLGLGAPPPKPEWGGLVAAGQPFLVSAWWITSMPALIIAIAVLAANRIAHALEPTRAHR